jgi:plasmid stabilization system protein ParE
MNLPLVFQADVRKDIDEAYTWYEDQRLGLGEQFMIEIQSVLDRIERNPELHALIYKDVRHIRVKRFPYAVYYRIEIDRIAVIAVHHSKRDPSRWQSRA